MRDLPVPARLYVTGVLAVGVLVVARGFQSVYLDRAMWSVVLPLMALFILADRLESPLPGGGVSGRGLISVTMPVAIASVLLTGPAGASLVAACTAVTAQRTQRQNRQLQ